MMGCFRIEPISYTAFSELSKLPFTETIKIPPEHDTRNPLFRSDNAYNLNMATVPLHAKSVISLLYANRECPN